MADDDEHAETQRHIQEEHGNEVADRYNALSDEQKANFLNSLSPSEQKLLRRAVRNRSKKRS